MKKFFTAFALIISILPLVLFAGCKKPITAQNVKNRSFYATQATKNVAVNQSALDNNLRIHFFDEYFRVEYGEEKAAGYGYYIGTFIAEGEEVKLEITEQGGAFKEKIPNELIFSKPLKFDNYVLSTEFVCGDLVIVKFKFELKDGE